MKTANVLFGVIVLIACTSVTHAQSTNPPPREISDENLTKARIRPIGDWSVDPVETQELNQIFTSSHAAANNVAPGTDYAIQEHAIENALREQLEDFIVDHPDSAYRPSL